MQEILLDTTLVLRCIIGFAVGALIGLERQKRMREDLTAGIRSFGLHSLMATLAAYSFTVSGSPTLFIYAIVISAILTSSQIVYKMFRTMRKGTTTSIVFGISFVLGALVGLDEAPLEGQLVGPLQVLAMTMSFFIFLVLGFKEEVASAVGVITKEEMISAVQLGVLIFFLWPLLPATWEIGPITLAVHQTYLLVVLLLSISFANYILVKQYRTRGTYFFGFFGGFANSEATVTSLADFHVRTERRFTGRISLSVIFANIAMVLRNGVLVLLIDPSLSIFRFYIIPLGILTMGGLVRLFHERTVIQKPDEEKLDTRFVSPFELTAALKFALVFTVVTVISLFLQDTFSDFGILIAAVFGGFVSAAALVSTVTTGYAMGNISIESAVYSVIIATTIAVLNKIIYVYSTDQEPELTKKVGRDSLLMAVGVLVYLALLAWGIFPWF
ncbi:MAG: MgtC/SapB family protein [Candidatus Thorarchaeota archaeon]|nr:MgtC/SapB family protein [Candidatus Thorarchaeota archaeon]